MEKMKKHLIAAVILSLCVLTCGCAKEQVQDDANVTESVDSSAPTTETGTTETESELIETESTETESTETEDDILPEGVTDMQKVLIKMSKETPEVEFGLIDLDRDGLYEACVEVNEDEFIILHEMNGEIYQYSFKEDSFEDFNKDGTFVTGKEEKNQNFYGNISFTEEEMKYELLASYYYADEETVYYTKHAPYGEEGAVEMQKPEFNLVKTTFDVADTAHYGTASLNKENVLQYVTREAEELTFETEISEDELSLIQKVMLNKAYFNGRQKLEDINSIFWGDEEYESLHSLRIVDLDHDGKDEACIEYANGWILILHEENEEIYGYLDSFRGLNTIYTDGISSGSDGASEWSFSGNTSFADYKYTNEVITSVYDEADGTTHYYKNGYDYDGVEISEVEFTEIMSSCGLVETVDYEYTVENILKYVPKKEYKSQFKLKPNVADEELTLMQKVLFNRETFNDGQKIAQVPGLFDEGYKEDVQFYVVDLDKDGVDEVIITYSPDKALILHEKEGKVYGYEDCARAYATLHTDGTSSYSGKFAGDDANFLLGKVSFENNEYTHKSIMTVIEEFSGIRYIKDGNGISGIEITKEEYEEIMSQYSKKEAEGYKYTLENILEHVK